MKKAAKLTSIALASTIAMTAFAGCQQENSSSSSESSNASSTSSTQSTTEKKEPVELNVYLFGTENGHYRNVDPVIEEFENRTKDTLNTTLNITWTAPADYAQKLQLWISSGEDMDLIFAVNPETYAKDGAFTDLGEYFNNPDYPGLQKAFSEDYINDNKLFDKTYIIPITNALMDMEGVYYRKDLLTKYGMSDISSYDDLYNFLEKISENEPDYVPYANYGTTAFFKLFNDPNERQLEGNVFSFIGNANPTKNFIDVQISDDGKSVQGIAAYGDPDSEWENFKEPYGKEYVLNKFNQAAKFNKFIPKDTLTNTTGTGKDTAAGFVTLSNFQSQEAKILQKYPDAEVGFWPIYKNNQDLTPNSQSTDGKAWNFLAVPSSSEKIDRTMEFLDWVYADQANNDLFTYGIEGVNWEAVGDDQWKLPDGVDAATNYLFPGYELSWNPTLYKIPAGLPEKLQEYYKFEFEPSSYQKNVLAGFTFDQEPVKNEIANCNTVIAKYLPFLLSGFGDVNENLANMNKELRDSGVENIKNELKNQLNEFLANKK